MFEGEAAQHFETLCHALVVAARRDCALGGEHCHDAFALSVEPCATGMY